MQKSISDHVATHVVDKSFELVSDIIERPNLIQVLVIVGVLFWLMHGFITGNIINKLSHGKFTITYRRIG